MKECHSARLESCAIILESLTGLAHFWKCIFFCYVDVLYDIFCVHVSQVRKVFVFLKSGYILHHRKYVYNNTFFFT